MPEDIAPVAPPPPPPPPPPPDTPPPPVTGVPPAKPPGPPRPEDDPNLAMSVLIAKRQKRKAQEPPKEGDKGVKQPDGPSLEDQQKSQEKLGGLIANALKFRKTEPKPGADPPKEPEPPKEPAKAAAKAPDGPPTTVGKRKTPPPTTDPATIASHAAAAATQAAVQALRGTTPSAPDPADSLREDDRHEYEVAQYLAHTNPKYKDAPKVILDQAKKAEAYAARWESANAGQVFNPEDEEHNQFFEGLTKPWSDKEFTKAEKAMEFFPVKEELRREYDAKLAAVQMDNARLELNPVVDRTFSNAAGAIAKSLGEDVFTKVSKGFDALQQEDPITADVLAQTLNGLHPIIETIIQIDDPKGRIPIDMRNPLHQQWNEIVTEGESRCVGIKDEQGRTFAKRADWVRMNDAQKAKHWFLTSDHIVTGIVTETSKAVGNYLQTEKARQKKIAESLGYVQKSGNNGTTDSSQTTNPPVPQSSSQSAPAATKPTSPTVGSGAKIDDTPKKVLTGRAALLDAMSNVLWKR